MAAGFFCGAFIADFFASDEKSLPLPYKLCIVLWLPIAFILPVALHELGHVAAGLLLGFRFRSYTVMIFHFYKEDERLKFKLIANNAKSFLGLALCLPPSGLNRNELTRRFAWYAFGGPAANFILGGTLLVPYFLSWSEIGKATPVTYTLATFALLCGVISLLLFLINIIPNKSGGFYTDGARILNVLRGGDQAFLDSAILSVMAASMGGAPPEELDEALLEEAAALPVESIFINYCHAYLYNLNLQRNQLAKARHHLRVYAAAVAQLPAMAQGSVWLELAFFEAMNGDLELAKEHYAKAVPSPFLTRDMFLRAEAAIALKEATFAQAQSLALEAQANLKHNPDKGAAKAYHRWLNQIVQEAELGVKNTYQAV
ncbi:hypothetical protein GCM10007389_00830 [Pontibacter akesuensis]|nr:hypothetical protein GCM10007389_00830 [Pontibacter akesuensis]